MRVLEKTTQIFGLKLIGILSAIVAVCFTLPAYAESIQDRLCEVYSDLYEGANKELASIAVSGIGDDSAPRETNRQLKKLNERIFQLITVTQMQFHGCTVPKVPSSDIAYIIDAIECSTSRLTEGLDTPECDRSSWTNTLEDHEIYQ